MLEKWKELDNKKKTLGVVLGVALVVVVVLVVVLAKGTNNTEVDYVATRETKNCPVDFQEYWDVNPEVYAYVEVPDTDVSYPILQREDDAEYYANHQIDGTEGLPGVIYTEPINSKEFTDNNTIIYGHNMKNGSMFHTLHNFENEDTFNANPYFTIYTPGKKLTYEVISAFKYDDRHIMNSFNFRDDDVYKEFLSMIQNPNSAVKNVRIPEKELTTDSKIVVLSTCITNQKSNRYSCRCEKR